MDNVFRLSQQAELSHKYKAEYKTTIVEYKAEYKTTIVEPLLGFIIVLKMTIQYTCRFTYRWIRWIFIRSVLIGSNISFLRIIGQPQPLANPGRIGVSLEAPQRYASF